MVTRKYSLSDFQVFCRERMAVEMEQCRGGGMLANSSHGPQVTPASVVGVTTAAQLKMQKLACSGGASPCPQSVSPLLPPTPPGSRSPPSSRLSPSPHQQQNNTQPQLQQQQQQHEPRPQHQQQRILPFSIDNILKPNFGISRSDYGRLHSSRSPEPPELLLRTPPKTPEVPSRHDSPVDLSHKANSIINNGISAGLGLNGGNKSNNEILLSHSISLLIGPHSHPLHPLQHHLQQTLLQQQHQQIQHVSQPHLQHPIITKPIPLSTSTAFQLFKPLSNFAEQQRRLQQQQHHLEQQQHHLQQQQQHQLRITSPHLKLPVPHQDHLNSNTQSQQSVNQHKTLHQHQKEQHQQPFKEHQPQQSPIQHQTILHQNTKTPLPAPSPTPSTCSTTSSCSSATSTTGSTKNSSLSPNNSSSSSSSKSGNSKPSSDSLEELVNPKIPEDNSNWPAWVYCTRYSDRPSSGPRSRRVKRHDRNPEEKRPRTAFTSDQLNRLKKEFDDNKYLTEKRRQDLARELGLNESQIKIWFQNKRAKIKKNSGPRSGLAQHLMAQGLYNHCTVPVDEDDPYLS